MTLDSSSEAEAGSGSSEGEEDSEEEQQPAMRRRTHAARGAKRQRTASKGDTLAAAKPYVPAPPAEPHTRSDMLSLLFACPALIGGCWVLTIVN